MEVRIPPIGSGLGIRGLREGDEGALSAFYGSLGDHTEYFFRPFRDRTPQAMAGVVSRTVAGEDLGYVAVSSDSEIVAHFFLADVKKEVPQLGIGIREGYQSGVLGGALMGILVGVARGLPGKRAIGLSVLKTNTRAFDLYVRCGFRITGQCSFRSANDSYLMELPFGERREGCLEDVRRHFCEILEGDVEALERGGFRIVESGRRAFREEALGGTFPLFGLLWKGRCLVGVSPEWYERVSGAWAGIRFPEEVFSEGMRERAAKGIGGWQSGEEEKPGVCAEWSVAFVCSPGEGNSGRGNLGRKLREEDFAAFRAFEEETGFSPPRESVWEGTAWGVMQEGLLISCAYALPGDGGSDRLGVLEFATLEGFRGRGYARQMVVCAIGALHRLGRIAVAECPFDNLAAICTVQSAGMRKHGDLLRVPGRNAVDLGPTQK